MVIWYLSGTSPIDNYGFVWAHHNNPTITDSVYYFNDKPPKGSFSARVDDDLVSGTEYFVRVFLKSSHDLYYGNEVQFKSLGSAGPAIDDFSPKVGIAQTVVT